jgi:N-acetylglucosaminyldiphosphoundecaprenol N-acetyl-beta-D-mannosaminyltransferase
VKPPPRIPLFGMEIDAVDRTAALDTLFDWLDEDTRGRYVVTPNSDHVVQFQDDAQLREAYRHASLVLADGVPLVWASRLLGRPLPGVVTGSDLVPALLARLDREAAGARIFFLGAGPGVAQRAADRVLERWPRLQICGTYSPAIGFERDEKEQADILRILQQAQPDVLIVGLGAPKQELWAARSRAHQPAKVTLCAGAAIDFLAGTVERAPPWMRGRGIEWIHRLLSQPRRLGPRYLRDAIIFPRLLAHEWLRARGGK